MDKIYDILCFRSEHAATGSDVSTSRYSSSESEDERSYNDSEDERSPYNSEDEEDEGQEL
jgi:hypothetical protein